MSLCPYLLHTSGFSIREAAAFHKGRPSAGYFEEHGDSLNEIIDEIIFEEAL
jgi:hypothetical protein